MTSIKDDLLTEAQIIYVVDDDDREREVLAVSAWRVAKMALRAPQTVYDLCDRGTLECYHGTNEKTGLTSRMVPVPAAVEYIESRLNLGSKKRTYKKHPTSKEPTPEEILTQSLSVSQDPLADFRPENRRPTGPA